MTAHVSSKIAYLFVFAFLVIAFGFVLVQPATAQRGGVYHLVAHSNQSSNAGVFRVNEATGQVSFCYVIGSSVTDVNVRCTPEVE